MYSIRDSVLMEHNYVHVHELMYYEQFYCTKVETIELSLKSTSLLILSSHIAHKHWRMKF